MGNSINTVLLTGGIFPEETVPKIEKQININVIQLEKIEESLTSTEEVKPDIVDEVEKTVESPKLPGKQPNPKDDQTAYLHLDDLVKKPGENGGMYLSSFCLHFAFSTSILNHFRPLWLLDYHLITFSQLATIDHLHVAIIKTLDKSAHTQAVRQILL